MYNKRDFYKTDLTSAGFCNFPQQNFPADNNFIHPPATVRKNRKSPPANAAAGRHNPHRIFPLQRAVSEVCYISVKIPAPDTASGTAGVFQDTISIPVPGFYLL